MEKIIEAVGVHKSYGENKALTDFSLEIFKGDLCALLGPNGAGKTTFVKALLNQVKVDEGSIRIFGIDSREAQARNKIAYLPEKFTFFPYYTVGGVIEFYGKMFGVKDINVDEILIKVGISNLRRKKIKELSKGQLQRVGIGSLLVGDRELLILDEPFSGLDPIGIKELKELLKELCSEGKTIFVNSHILSEMEVLCNQVAILKEGHCLFFGNIKAITEHGTLEDFFYKKVKNHECN